jgi:pimeloyl-ACP methyl ester carboxylesterase
LVERGQHVFTPSLTGLGDRRHLAEPEIGLTGHVEDIVSLLVVEDLRKVVLVGHSYAGLVVGGVAQREPDRLRHIVFLDAFLPEPGRSLQDMVPGFEFERIARERGDGWKIPMDAVFSLEALGVHDEEDKTWMEPRLTDQPIRTFTEASSITRKTLTSVPCSYIQSSSIPTFAQAAAEARKRGWAVREMVDAGHDSMVTKPKELVEVMLALMNGSG